MRDLLNVKPTPTILKLISGQNSEAGDAYKLSDCMQLKECKAKAKKIVQVSLK